MLKLKIIGMRSLWIDPLWSHKKNKKWHNYQETQVFIKLIVDTIVSNTETSQTQEAPIKLITYI